MYPRSNGPPARDVADAADRRAGPLGLYLGDAEEPPKVLVAAVKDVVPDPLRYGLRQFGRLPSWIGAHPEILPSAWQWY